MSVRRTSGTSRARPLAAILRPPGLGTTISTGRRRGVTLAVLPEKPLDRGIKAGVGIVSVPVQQGRNHLPARHGAKLRRPETPEGEDEGTPNRCILFDGQPPENQTGLR